MFRSGSDSRRAVKTMFVRWRFREVIWTERTAR